jgi:hypothetical protein
MGAAETPSTIIDARNMAPVMASDDERDCIRGGVWIINDLLKRTSWPSFAGACFWCAGGRPALRERAPAWGAARQQQRKRACSPRTRRTGSSGS